MNSLRLLALTAVCAVLAAPVASAAAPAASSASCMAPSASLVHRRVSDEAARGLPSLISFVHRTQPIYHLHMTEAVEMLDEARAHRAACMSASADAVY